MVQRTPFVHVLAAYAVQTVRAPQRPTASRLCKLQTKTSKRHDMTDEAPTLHQKLRAQGYGYISEIHAIDTVIRKRFALPPRPNSKGLSAVMWRHSDKISSALDNYNCKMYNKEQASAFLTTYYEEKKQQFSHFLSHGTPPESNSPSCNSRNSSKYGLHAQSPRCAAHKL